MSLTVDDFDFPLPPELIAQHPAATRTGSRLLHVCGQQAFDRQFENLPEFLSAGDLLVFNDTRVIKARFFGCKETGGLVRTAQPLWLYAYFDATDLCEFILECCKVCVEEDLLTEVVYLRAHDATVKDLEAWLDMRQSALNALIDIIVQGNGTLSKSKRKHKLVEGLSEEQIDRIEKTVSEHFENYIDSRA